MIITSSACSVGCVSGTLACCRDFFMLNFIMSKRGDNGIRGVTAIFSFAYEIICPTDFGTGCRLAFVLLLNVAERCNSFLSNEYFTAIRTMTTFCQTCFGASRSNCGICDNSVTKFIYVISNITISTVTSVSGITFCGTSRRSYGRSVRMSKCINCYGIFAKLRTANGAVNYVIVRAVVYTIGINVVFNYDLTRGMTESGNLFGIRIFASTTGKGLNSLLSAGRSCCDYTVIIRVPKCVHVGVNICISAMASVGSKAFFGTSGRSYGRSVRMPECINCYSAS